jgi:hypothetical protein
VIQYSSDNLDSSVSSGEDSPTRPRNLTPDLNLTFRPKFYGLDRYRIHLEDFRSEHIKYEDSIPASASAFVTLPIAPTVTEAIWLQSSIVPGLFLDLFGLLAKVTSLAMSRICPHPSISQYPIPYPLQ